MIKVLQRYEMMAITLLLLLMSLGTSVWAASPSPVYDQVMEALSALPRNGGITVDFGVEETRYSEQFVLTDVTLRLLRETNASATITEQLAALKGQKFEKEEPFTAKERFMEAVEQAIGQENAMRYEDIILNSAYDGNAAFAIGDAFEARFRADSDCYIALIHIGVDTKDTAGNIVILLPNQHVAAPRIEAGKVYSTTEDFSIGLNAGLPAGYEVINLLCSTEPFDLFEKTGTFLGEYAIITPTDETALQYLLHGLQQAGSGKFGGTSLELSIGGGSRAFRKKFGKLKPMGGTGTTGKFFPALD